MAADQPTGLGELCGHDGSCLLRTGHDGDHLHAVVADRPWLSQEATASTRLDGETFSVGPVTVGEPVQEPASGPVAPDPTTDRGTGVGGPHARPETDSIERGRQIAMTAMDLAEARYRHEHGQPHRRDHCEDCARQAVAEAARPVHYRDASASLRSIAEHLPDTASAEALRPGIEYAATRLRHTADGMGGTDG